MREDKLEFMLYRGALEKLDLAITERIKRLGAVALSGGSPRMVGLAEKWQKIEDAFKRSFVNQGDLFAQEKFLEIIEKSTVRSKGNYLRVIKGLSREDIEIGKSWLQEIVDDVNHSVWELL